jgi:hypothetical protein
MDLSDYAPKSRPAPIPTHYVGGDGVHVSSTLDGDIVLVAAEDPIQPTPSIERQQSTAGVSFTGMDFLATTAETGIHVNAGYVSYVYWDGLKWLQTYVEMGAQDVDVTSGIDTQYLHLVIRLKTFIPTADDQNAPFVSHNETGTLGDYSYAQTTEWQGIHPDDQASYEVTEDEEWVAPSTPFGEEPRIYFSCMLASIDNANGLRVHHCGAISIPQGYAANFVHISP